MGVLDSSQIHLVHTQGRQSLWLPCNDHETISQTVANRIFWILAASQSLEDGFGLAKQVCVRLLAYILHTLLATKKPLLAEVPLGAAPCLGSSDLWSGHERVGG